MEKSVKEPSLEDVSKMEWINKKTRACMAFFITVTIIAMPFPKFFLTAHIIGESMMPFVYDDDRALCLNSSYVKEYHRGDVVGFVLEDENMTLIKRIIAVGGDTIEIKDGNVYINDELLEEPYLLEPDYKSWDYRTYVPEGMVFVMGDNRRVSKDSREFGCVNESCIYGKYICKLWGK
ncbi:MAG: signal peptidase I [Wujia sp.]